MGRGPALAVFNLVAVGTAVVMAAVALSRTDQAPAQQANASPPESTAQAARASAPVERPPPPDRTPELRAVYESSKAKLPPHDLVCFPRTSAVCIDGECQTGAGSVFTLVLSGGEPSLSRCDEAACDTYPAVQDVSGSMATYQPQRPRGFFVKLDVPKLTYAEVVTLETRVTVNQGTCSTPSDAGQRAAHESD